MRRLWTLFLFVGLAGCAAAPAPAPAPGPGEAPEATAPADPERPLLYPMTVPPRYQAAIQRGTRTETGEPGPRYWSQRADYTLTARVDEQARTLTGSGTIRYHNRSPDTLGVLVLNLIQNFHAPGAIRLEEAEVTGGVTIDRVALGGQELGPTTGRTPGWAVESTLMYVVPRRPIMPGSTVELEVDWNFPIPQAGASGRMGYSGDDLFFLAYWFPQMAVYDDVAGWHTDPFRGNAEFYSDFGDYDLTIDAPAGWLVMATGSLENPEAVLQPRVIERLRAAESSDDVVTVVTHEQAAGATRSGTDGRLHWRFRASDVRDAAFALMRDYAWDAARSPVGDRTGDGATDYTRVDAFWRERAPLWSEVARYSQHSIDFLSRFTGLPYPWPHMSAVEGGGIIGGGMEFPMMTIMGDYNAAGDSALYYVTAHELAHMWMPMMLSTNERRYAWLDEGNTTFSENNARAEFFPGSRPYQPDQRSYANIVRAAEEGPIMRWSDFHYSPAAYGIASYAKPASVLHALRGVLGEETFDRGWQALHNRWQFRHPYPWDMFATFEDVAGRDLDWFWRAWYQESTQDGAWYLDQAVADVGRLEDGQTRITIRDNGWIPMPVLLRVTRSDGTTLDRRIEVDDFLEGRVRTTLTIPAGAAVERVEIDPDRYFPDLDRANNVWTR